VSTRLSKKDRDTLKQAGIDISGESRKHLQLAAEECSTLEFALHEVGNSVWKRVLRKEISKEAAMSVQKRIPSGRFRRGSSRPVAVELVLLKASLELAVQEKLTTYDSAFIELAHRNKCELVTWNGRQRDVSKKNFPAISISFIK
jgi:predicted nucleic acid-binding protein